MSGFPTEETLSSPRAWARARVLPGTGLVGRRGDILLVVPVLPRAQHARARELVELCSRPDPAGQAFVDGLWALLDRQPAGELPGFALLVRAGHSLRAFVHGPVRILVDGRPVGRPGAGGGGELTEHVLEDGAWTGLTVAADGDTVDGETLDGETVDADPGPADVDVLPLDLESGTVPGGGVILQRIPAAPEEPSSPAVPARAPTSATALRPAVQFRTVLLGECATRTGQGGRVRARPPLPVAGSPGEDAVRTTGPEVLVEGVRCPDGHFTDPERSTCRTCGLPLPADGHRERRPRPPLGVVVTDGGTVYAVTGDFVIGREPERAPDVLAGKARPLPLRDAARSTSRVHAHLTVEGWRVLLSDESSANGTLVSRHGAAGPWLPVPPRAPLALEHGDRVRLGKRQLLFDAWRETVVPRVLR